MQNDRSNNQRFNSPNAGEPNPGADLKNGALPVTATGANVGAETGAENDATISLESHITLHYRVSLDDDDSEVISTFGGRPATLSLGLGQLAEPLERCLIGLCEDSESTFVVAQAYGQRNPDMVQSISRAMLDANTHEAAFELGDLLEFPTPRGGRYAGVLKDLNDQQAVIDFNHPLSGRTIRFKVKIIGVL